MSGGAGYVLSREALDRFVLNAMHDRRTCHRGNDGIEDVEIGNCLSSVGVVAGDSRDEHGRERFHPFTPDLHLIHGSVPRDNWYWEYNYYPTREVCLTQLIDFGVLKSSYVMSHTEPISWHQLMV